MITKLGVLATALLFSACATGGNNTTTDAGIPRFDMSGTVNQTPFDGVGVVPRASAYTMHVESKEDIDLLTVTSCHRDFSAQAAVKQGWWKEKRGFDYVYQPAPGIEDNARCLIRLGTYNKSTQGLNGHAVIMLQDPAFSLPAENICDGADGQAGGVSLCQSKTGLQQRIRFPVQVHLVSDGSLKDACRGEWIDAYTYQYELSNDECALVFDEVAPPHRKHLHMTFRYTYTKIRGE